MTEQMELKSQQRFRMFWLFVCLAIAFAWAITLSESRSYFVNESVASN